MAQSRIFPLSFFTNDDDSVDSNASPPVMSSPERQMLTGLFLGFMSVIGLIGTLAARSADPGAGNTSGKDNDWGVYGPISGFFAVTFIIGIGCYCNGSHEQNTPRVTFGP